MNTVCMNTSILILQLPLIIYFNYLKKKIAMNDLTEHRSLYRNRSEEAAATESQKTEDSLKLSKNVKLFKKENK